MHKITLLFAALLFVVGSAHSQDNSQIVYREYFHSKTPSTPMPPWTLFRAIADKNPEVPTIARSPRGIRLLGLYDSADSLNLLLKDLPEHTHLSVDIAFHIVGKWDGETDNDRFKVIADDKHLIDATFSNTTSQQSWPALTPSMKYPPRATARNSNMLAYPSRIEEVYVGPMDATYETTIIIAHTSSNVALSITAALNNIVAGEEIKKWGLEHVVVRVGSDTIVPQKEYSVSESAFGIEGLTDAREIAEFVQDEDFPGLKAGSEFERGLHVTITKAECHSCGDYCLWYSYRFYTDGWVNIFNNKPAKGRSTVSMQINAEDLDSIRVGIAECLEQPLQKEYHEAAYEDAHPDLTHCSLVVRLGKREGHTEVYAGEPESVQRLLKMVMRILARYGWQPIPG